MFKFLKSISFNFDEIAQIILDELHNKISHLEPNEIVVFTRKSVNRTEQIYFDMLMQFGRDDLERISYEIKMLSDYEPEIELVNNEEGSLYYDYCLYRPNLFTAVFDYVMQFKSDSGVDAYFFVLLYEECMKKVKTKPYWVMSGQKW
jgi:hypothetical protein